MIEFKKGEKELFNFQITCEVCGRKIEKSYNGAVVLDDYKFREGHKKRNFWFTHKGACHNSLERLCRSDSWWELSWFIQNLLESFEDLGTNEIEEAIARATYAKERLKNFVD
jgi:hypothetical protein